MLYYKTTNCTLLPLKLQQLFIYRIKKVFFIFFPFVCLLASLFRVILHFIFILFYWVNKSIYNRPPIQQQSPSLCIKEMKTQKEHKEDPVWKRKRFIILQILFILLFISCNSQNKILINIYSTNFPFNVFWTFSYSIAYDLCFTWLFLLYSYIWMSNN